MQQNRAKEEVTSSCHHRLIAASLPGLCSFVFTPWLLYNLNPPELCETAHAQTFANGKLVAKGQLGGAVSIEDGQKAARACAINLLAQLKAALGDLDKVARVVRWGGFINSAAGFVDGPKVMNGASDLMVEVFGDKGRHARTTVGVSTLPGDAAVEVEGTFEVAST